MGYAVEMWLKLAAFRFDGARPADLIEPRLAPARRWLSARGVLTPHEGYHSLVFWLAYLRERRAAARRTLDRKLDGELVHRVGRLYQVWWVEMRYHPDAATFEDVHRFYGEATWLREHAARLSR